MKRCQHPHVEITEYGTATTYHQRGYDGNWFHDSEFGSYTGMVHVYCGDCGLNRSYGKARPKWLEQALKDATTTSEKP